ncbi:YopX family protein [Streptococcus sp. LPB0406]|nr:YopX family protein [Streptococcus sp. LPB0406]MBZ1354039.1 YopX family protein [Streptococcus sp. LPB0406]
MIPNFRAYDNGSLSRMYQPDEVMVGNGDIWIIDEDSVAGEWIVNNDLNLMQSTGLFDRNGKEIFEGDILGTKDGLLNGVVEYRSDLGMWTNSLIRYNNFERLCNVANSREIIGNIYENPEILEENE